MIGLMVDLHGTLLESNQAWAKALESIDPDRSEFYRQQIQLKRSRHELAEIAGVSFDDLQSAYRRFLFPRDEVIGIIRSLSDIYPMVLVTNAERNRVLDDLEHLQNLPFLRVYTREDGKKPNPIYLQRILDEQGWGEAFLIGNDLTEDYSENKKITSIIIPQRKLIEKII
ncbi:MAG: hypothetical protein KKC19_02885 [Nanoarchaeota archaeon]|nr:hypothetical protein [Nanoarchaeota archaeon]